MSGPPWGDQATIAKMDILRKQFVNWDGSAPRNRNRTGLHTDLVMSLWFAWTVFRRSRMAWNSEVVVADDPIGYEMSTWDIGSWDSHDTAPWAS